MIPVLKFGEADITGEQYYEPEGKITTYSSLMTKQIVQYQNGTANRSLAAASTVENTWLPTSLGRMLTLTDGEVPPNFINVSAWSREALMNGYRVTPFDKGFNPTLLMQLENMNPNPTGFALRWTIDFEFDISVRGLRNTEQ